MRIFSSEAELLEVLDQADALIAACTVGTLEFSAFHRELGHLHSYHALDGHEYDDEELSLLEKYRARIDWIERVLNEVGEVCADEDAPKAAYIKAGRFGTAEALRRLRALVERK